MNDFCELIYPGIITKEMSNFTEIKIFEFDYYEGKIALFESGIVKVPTKTWWRDYSREIKEQPNEQE